MLAKDIWGQRHHVHPRLANFRRSVLWCFPPDERAQSFATPSGGARPITQSNGSGPHKWRCPSNDHLAARMLM